MNRKQAGFTLIELVIVIIVLGILAAVAVPKLIDFEGSATTAKGNYNTSSGAEETAAKDGCVKATASAGTSSAKCS